MLLLHMQEIVFVDSQEGLLSSRGGGGADILAPGLHSALLSPVHALVAVFLTAEDISAIQNG